MYSKNELQTMLKEQYGINKNISRSLSAQECSQLLVVLQRQPSAIKLVESFSNKNNELSKNNRHYGQLRGRAERKLETERAQYDATISQLQVEQAQFEQQVSQLQQERQQLTGQLSQLEADIAQMQSNKGQLKGKKDVIAKETAQLRAEITRLSYEKKNLTGQVTQLSSQNTELSRANTELMKDNKTLKNTVDQIRLRLAKDINRLLEHEDSEIKKAMIRMLKWTLG